MTDPGLPLTTGEGSGLDKTPAELLAEMRAFALTLPDDLGPLFGRDVARMCDECGRLREQLAESEAANESYAVEAKMAREQLDALLTACTFVSSLPGDTGSPKPPSIEAWSAARACSWG